MQYHYFLTKEDTLHLLEIQKDLYDYFLGILTFLLSIATVFLLWHTLKWTRKMAKVNEDIRLDGLTPFISCVSISYENISRTAICGYEDEGAILEEYRKKEHIMFEIIHSGHRYFESLEIKKQGNTEPEKILLQDENKIVIEGTEPEVENIYTLKYHGVNKEREIATTIRITKIEEDGRIQFDNTVNIVE